MSKNSLNRIPMRFLYLLFFFLTFLSSCKKIDKPDQVEVNVKEKFFALPKDASPLLKRIVADLKKKEEEHPFVENFVKTQGYIRWDHARLISRNRGATYRDNVDEGQDTVLLFPTEIPYADYVKSILSIKINMETLYKLYEGELYYLQGFDKDSSRTTPNADDVVNQLMKFEQELYSADYFKITDNRIFDYWGIGMVKPNTFVAKLALPDDDPEDWPCSDCT